VKLTGVLVLVLALSGIPAGAREVCAGFGGSTSPGCCCQGGAPQAGDGITAHCGCAMNGAPQSQAPEPLASNTERVETAAPLAASVTSAVSDVEPLLTTAGWPLDEFLRSQASPSYLVLCTFRC